MGTEIQLVNELHTRTSRNYLERVTEHDKAECATVAKRFGQEYWDGDRKYGYGGFRYDGRWEKVARRMVERYQLKPGHRVLDIGCGKGFLLFELTKLVPGLSVTGLDVSRYAIENAKPEVRQHLVEGTAADLSRFSDRSFDFVFSITTLHNLHLPDLWSALGELERVRRGGAYLCVESYRNEREKANLLYWQLTCEAFFTPQEWTWLFQKTGYSGDYEFIVFE